MVDDREPDHVTERTTVVHTEGRRGGGGTIALVIMILLVLVGLYLFRDQIFGGADKVDKIDVDITANSS